MQFNLNQISIYSLAVHGLADTSPHPKQIIYYLNSSNIYFTHFCLPENISKINETIIKYLPVSSWCTRVTLTERPENNFLK